ncbi:MAG: M48 family metalloprotease [Akkermansiaceae bacterium]|nr:M48 family metalloprotease [Akkermansiaceae bacterium]
MNRLGFDELVDQLELKYANKGDLLLRTTLWWAFFGYAVLAMSLLVSFAIVGICLYLVIIAPSFVTIKIGAIFGITAGAVGLAILRGVWVRLSRPEGSILTAELSPQLFNMIEEISSSAGGVKFDRVLLTQDMNAAVVQIPRAGIFGFHQNYLILGLPLMDALNVDEFKAVLAHEFAHLSNQHGRAGNWIYRIRLTWARVAENLAQQTGYLISPLQRFLGWFWPRFNARAFVFISFERI